MLKKLIMIFFFILLAASINIYRLNRAPLFMNEQRFVVDHGQNVRSVAGKLKTHNIIRSKRYFILASYIIGRRYIKAGEYKILKGMSSLEILRKMTRGDILTRRVTIPEGYNMYQVAGRLEKKSITDKDQFLYYASNRQFLRSIKIYASTADGYLFPDTYVLPQSSDARDIIVIMHNRLLDVLADLAQDHEQIKKYNIHKILTMASLIEKEARKSHERKYISSVFHNRMRNDMRLDCDPTVRYAVKKFRGRITYNDLQYDSPYNTYTRKGLPPTPISSVSRESIIAVLEPAQTNYLYFVARKDGSHYFSKNLGEHNRAVRYYIKGDKNGFVDRQSLH